MASWCLLLGLCAGLFLSASAVTVETRHGTLRGSVVSLNNGQEIRVFKGVPFARPPVGDLRFARTQTVENWEGIRDATEFGSSCSGSGTHPTWDNIAEDCLNMNIYTPHPTGPDRLAVMVYYHGGAYTSGANLMYPGYFHAAKGVIMVVANYRLAAAGWVSTSDSVAPGNWGLWDQRQSLIFIRDNIAAFGGDPNRVTIFGQSAGGSSSGIHLLSPHTAGLFHQAIMISGTGQAPWAYNPTWLPPEEYTRQIARQLDCPTAESQPMIDCLRTKTFEEIRSTSTDVISGYISQGFAPVPDGPDGFLPDDPYKLRQEGKFHKNVKVMAGHTSEDGTTYLLPFVHEAMDGGWNRSAHYQFIRNRMISWVLARDPQETQEYTSRAIQMFFTDWPYDEQPDNNRRALRDAVTDVGFGAGQDYTLKSHAQYNATYEYLFGYLGCPHYHILPEWFGVIHGIGDLPFHWGWCQVVDHPELLEDSGMDLMTLFPWTQRDKRFSNFSITMFTNFAKYGNPTPQPVSGPGEETEGPITWQPFTRDNYRYLYIGNDKIEGRENLNQRNNAFWMEYAEWIVFERNATLTNRRKARPTREPHPVDLGTNYADFVMEKMFERAKELKKNTKGTRNHPYDPECDEILSNRLWTKK